MLAGPGQQGNSGAPPRCHGSQPAVRRNGNLLLCTLLLGTTLVNNAISIVLADVTTGLIGLFIATAAILLFGEVGEPRHRLKWLT